LRKEKGPSYQVCEGKEEKGPCDMLQEGVRVTLAIEEA